MIPTVYISLALLARHVVRVTWTEDVTHMTAWHKLQRASAHPRLFFCSKRQISNKYFTVIQSIGKEPYSKGNLQVLSAPNFHAVVIAADFEEVVLLCSEQTAGHGWRRVRVH